MIDLQIVDRATGKVFHWTYFMCRKIGPDRFTGRTSMALDTEQAVALRNELNDFINAQLKGKR